jgi:hypothetical protein
VFSIVRFHRFAKESDLNGESTLTYKLDAPRFPQTFYTNNLGLLL